MMKLWEVSFSDVCLTKLNLHVALARCKLVVDGVLDVDDVEATVMAFAMSDDTNTTHVATTGGHCNDARVELDEVGDLARRKVDLYGIVDLDGRVRIADSVFRQLTLQPNACPTADRCGELTFVHHA
jgi:hypothetical protein